MDQHAIVSITDRDGAIIYANQEFCDITQRTTAEVIGQNHRFSKSGYHTTSFYKSLWDTITQYAIEPSQLMPGVAETAVMEELIKSLDTLTRLRMKGIHLSIDDFGTGYTSLVQLYPAPFSELKIDRSFILEMANNKEARAIIETVILLGHKLDMKVVTEGIETEESLKQLAAMGCDLGQGYHIARPMLSDAITTWLAQRSVLARVNLFYPNHQPKRLNISGATKAKIFRA